MELKQLNTMKELKIKKIRPLFTSLITTMDRYEEDLKEGGLIVRQKGSLKENQKIVAVGENVRGMKVGDLVNINPKRYGVKKHQAGSMKDGVVTDNPVITYDFNIVEMNGNLYLMLQDSDINYVIEEYDEVEANPEIILPDNKIIL